MPAPSSFLLKRAADASGFLYYTACGEEQPQLPCVIGIKFTAPAENSGIPIAYTKFSARQERFPGFDEYASGPASPRIAFRLPDKKRYIEKCRMLKTHIQRGDIYEINFCVEFSAGDVSIDPFKVFSRLDALSYAPHACLAKFGATWVICSSPERFLQRKGNTLITQPIKGTARRGNTPEEDERLKTGLRNSLKEQTENVMIVDVARHDLSRLAGKGTVKVEELFGIYSFKQVHQMISTVSCELKENSSFDEILRATFPMASMTGAPKIRAVQLIEEHEDFDRGFYSGSIGVLQPGGDFDLNVVIRSIIYDEERRRISFAAGSALTALSDPEQEWEECMLKAKAMMEVLQENYK